MSYVALYRKYRPTTFKEIVGQEHIIKILKSQVENDKISHAYIFSGVRGTGKTSAAKIFARAINCLNLQDGEPCNECEACKSILNSNSTDVVEMDAASNNSVENIRSIRQEVVYATNELKYKVYIIDEAHMLSTSAFNALLKTLEEPPKNVIFILATTEEHKILPTILSRCIRFEFKKISNSDIVKRLKEVLDDMHVEYEEEALMSIAKMSDGAVRDALSILDRCINSGDKITNAKLQEIVGTIEKDILILLAQAIIKRRVKEVSQLSEKILQKGNDLRYITSILLEIFIEILEKYADIKEDKIDASVDRLNYIIKQLSKLDDEIRQSSNAGILFKAKVLELSTTSSMLEEATLMARIMELETRINILESQRVNPSSYELTESFNGPDKKGKENVAREKNEFEEIEYMDKLVKKALDSDSLKIYSALVESVANRNKGEITFVTSNLFAFSILNKDEAKEEIKKMLQDITGEGYAIRVKLEEKNIEDSKNKFEEIVLDSNIPFEIVD